MRTIRLVAMSIEGQCVFGNVEAALFGDSLLPFLDLVIEKLFHPPAIEAYEMIVVRTRIEFEHGLSGLEMIAVQQARLLELCQHTVHSCQTDIHVFGQQDFVNIFRTQVADRAVLENLKYL